MKLKVIIFLVLKLSSWLQQLLGKTYGLRYQNGVMVNDSFDSFRKTKSCRKHVLFVASDFVTESQMTNMNDQKNIQSNICHWQLKPEAGLIFLSGRVAVSEENATSSTSI